MPVDIVCNAIEDLLKYANMTNQLFSDSQTVAKLYNVLNKTCCFDRAITKWNHHRQPVAERTSTENLKIHF